MSMRSSFIYGYGFNCDCDDGTLVDFIKEHKDTFCKTEKEKELYNEMFNYDHLENLFEHYSCDNTGMEGIGAVITNIMSRETGIRFVYCPPDDECNTFASVVFKQGYPWQLNESEKELTEEKLSNICKKYMDELRITDVPDYLELEYYG